ncbi:hypothetical protein SBRY_20990 [Actinacidiphila bryophytorum]|uniref:Uncharacterized protein n=1 Tax=Actinacidiphila bryophytorum TaxID=1436133 RepID=A0A9W4EDP2_9ACTN|nr:hypothetical protein SBRY_20990 [Actinacidiphila bryophytorum]
MDGHGRSRWVAGGTGIRFPYAQPYRQRCAPHDRVNLAAGPGESNARAIWSLCRNHRDRKKTRAHPV